MMRYIMVQYDEDGNVTRERGLTESEAMEIERALVRRYDTGYEWHADSEHPYGGESVEVWDEYTDDECICISIGCGYEWLYDMMIERYVG